LTSILNHPLIARMRNQKNSLRSDSFWFYAFLPKGVPVFGLHVVAPHFTFVAIICKKAKTKTNKMLICRCAVAWKNTGKRWREWIFRLFC